MMKNESGFSAYVNVAQATSVHTRVNLIRRIERTGRLERIAAGVDRKDAAAVYDVVAVADRRVNISLLALRSSTIAKSR
jgi:hypothetical protein